MHEYFLKKATFSTKSRFFDCTIHLMIIIYIPIMTTFSQRTKAYLSLSNCSLAPVVMKKNSCSLFFSVMMVFLIHY